MVPLQVIHEFLLMRLEQKPTNPSPLSVRQLMRELKEGIKIATKQRQRIIMYLHTALQDKGCVKDWYVDKLDALDRSLLQVFNDYLEYMEQWALLEHDTFQKNMLEEEWNFICEQVPYIMGGWTSAIQKICKILCTMLQSIGERLMERIENASVISKEYGDINKK